ncbi:MAG: ketoacyl-synthetase C-terminal extension domain-containing protein [Umezawaea sp.]
MGLPNSGRCCATVCRRCRTRRGAGLNLATPWPGGDCVPAGVSSFGLAGTNCHAAVPAAPRTPPAGLPTGASATGASTAGGPVAWGLSGHGDEALREQADRVVSHVERPGATGVRDIGFSPATTRAALPRRAVLVGDSAVEVRSSASRGPPATAGPADS